MAVEGKSKRRKKKGSPADGFQRRSRPVRVRSGIWDWRRWHWKKIAVLAVLGLLSASVLGALGDYVNESERFRFPLDGSGLAISGLDRLDSESVQQVFEADFGQPLATLSLEDRREELIALPWVRGATLSRIWPDRVWVDVAERQPVAFLRLGAGRRGNVLIDEEGVLLEPLPGVEFDLPVVDGIERNMEADQRIKRVQLLQRLVTDLDSAEPAYSQRFGQVDLSDPKNAVATVVHKGAVFELQMGDKLFRHRFDAFLTNVASWEKTYGKLAKIDLRFEDKVFMEALEDVASGQQRR